MLNVIQLYWDGPHSVSYDRVNQKYFIHEGGEKLVGNTIFSSGVYQVYGNHPVYGRGSLLYIGKVSRTNNSKRNFKKRIVEHLSGKFWYENEITLYFSTVGAEDESCLDDIESLLIAVHKPAMNSQNLIMPTEGAKNIHILNLDFRGGLVPECSGLWFDFK